MENEENIMLAYIAGIMDGDGSFSLCKRKNLPSPLFYPEIQLANKSPWLAEFLKNKFGGYIHYRKEWKGEDGGIRKPSWRWKIEKSRCKDFLKKIIPFLCIKKERAAFLFDYIRNNVFKRGIKLSNDIIQSREASYSRMMSFNRDKDVNTQLVSKRRKTPTTDPLFWSYVSGLFDSDGSFSVKRETKRNRISKIYSPVISLSLTDICSINYLAKSCPYGRIFKIKAPTCRYGINYRFYIGSQEEAVLFIEKCLPYLKLKKENALILSRFCKENKRTRYCKAGVSKEENSFRERCYQDLKKANNGIYKSPLIDLEVLRQDDRGEGAGHAERLNKETSI